MLLSKEVISKNTVGYGLLSRDKISNHSIFGPTYDSPGIDSYTKLMLHMNGTNGSTIFTDSSLSPKTMTANGNAQISTSQYVFGGASGLFDGTGDYIDTPDSTDFDVSNGDFTVDFRLRRGGIGTVQYICGQCDSTGSNATTSMFIRFNANNTVTAQICSGASAYAATSTGTITDTTNFYHLAYVRFGNNTYLFIGGAQDGTANVTGVTVNNSANRFAIGRIGEFAAGGHFNGYIDEFRFSKGIARWTTNFTPPTIEYAA